MSKPKNVGIVPVVPSEISNSHSSQNLIVSLTQVINY